MTAMTIRDVPDATVKALTVRAARAGKSLQAYALDLLVREAETATHLEHETRADLSTADILDAIENRPERR